MRSISSSWRQQYPSVHKHQILPAHAELNWDWVASGHLTCTYVASRQWADADTLQLSSSCLSHEQKPGSPASQWYMRHQNITKYSECSRSLWIFAYIHWTSNLKFSVYVAWCKWWFMLRSWCAMKEAPHVADNSVVGAMYLSAMLTCLLHLWSLCCQWCLESNLNMLHLFTREAGGEYVAC